MNKLQELAKQLDGITDQIDAVLDAAENETRDLTEEETANIETLETQAEELKAEMEALEEAAKKQKELRERQAARREFLNSSADSRLVYTVPDSTQTLTIPAEARRRGPIVGFNGPDAERDAYLCSMWASAVLLGRQSSREWLERNAPHYLAQVGSDNTRGGVFVPTEMHTAIIDLMEEYGLFRQKADRASMGSDTATWPKFLSGLTVYFTGEETATTESEIALGQITLTCRTVSAMARISNDLAEDAVIDLASLVARKMAYAFAVKEDACGFLGDGSSTYGGIVGLITACAGAAGSIHTALAGNTAFSTLDLVDFEAMVGKLPEIPGIRPEWYISKAGWGASMMRLADAAGGNTAEDIEGKRTKTFLGYPVNLVQTMNSTLTAQTSTNGLCYFGDLQMAATFGDRRSFSIDSTTDRYFEYRQTGVLGSERFDINCHSVGDASNAGPIVMLATPGA